MVINFEVVLVMFIYTKTNTHVDKEVFDSIYHKSCSIAASSTAAAKPANFMLELLQQVLQLLLDKSTVQLPWCKKWMDLLLLLRQPCKSNFLIF